jgi:hypothetical protein
MTSPVDEERPYLRGIRMEIPVKFTHYTVDVSRDWAVHTGISWDREDMAVHGRGRPRTSEKGFFPDQEAECSSFVRCLVSR